MESVIESELYCNFQIKMDDIDKTLIGFAEKCGQFNNALIGTKFYIDVEMVIYQSCRLLDDTYVVMKTTQDNYTVYIPVGYYFILLVSTSYLLNFIFYSVNFSVKIIL